MGNHFDVFEDQSVEAGVERAQTILDTSLQLGLLTGGQTDERFGGLTPKHIHLLFKSALTTQKHKKSHLTMLLMRKKISAWITSISKSLLMAQACL